MILFSVLVPIGASIMGGMDMVRRTVGFGLSSLCLAACAGCSIPGWLGGYGTIVGAIVDTASLVNIIAGSAGLAPIFPNT